MNDMVTIRKREEEAMTQRDMGNTVLKKKSKKRNK
jgi:hypothetical protein